MFRSALLAAVFAAGSGGAHAATLTTTLSTWLAGAGPFVVSDGIGGADGDTLSAVHLTSGTTLGASPAVTKDNLTDDAPLAPLADGYAGDVLLSNGSTLTLTVPSGLSGFAFGVVTGSSNFFGPSSYTTTVTLSDGTSASAAIPTFDPSVGTSAVQFFGYYGGGETSVTISSADPNGFTVVELREVPEPAAALTFALGLTAIAALRRR